MDAEGDPVRDAKGRQVMEAIHPPSLPMMIGVNIPKPLNGESVGYPWAVIVKFPV